MSKQRNANGFSLVIPPEVMDHIRGDEEFIAVISLGRMVNAIQFSLHTLRECPSPVTPAQIRQGVNAFLSCGSLLFEAVRHVNVLGEKYPAFADLGTFRKPYADASLADFEETVTKTIRNKIVSHFDAEVFETGLEHLPPGPVILAQAHTNCLDDLVFTLSDDLVLNYLSYSFKGDWHAPTREFVTLVETLIGLSQEFIGVVVGIISHVVRERRWAVIEEHTKGM